MAVSPQLLASLLRDPRMAQAQQAQQSAFAQPTTSPLQGLAQMLQQGLGGYMQRQVTNEYEQRSNKLGADQNKLYGALLSGDTAGAMAAAGSNPDLADIQGKLALGTYEGRLAAESKKNEPYNLGEGEKRMQGGNVIASGPDKKTTDLRDYEAAVAQGFGGTFMDYQTALKKAGASNTSISVSNSTGKKLGEGIGTGIADQINAGAETARGAVKSIATINRIREAVDGGGVYIGPGATVQTALAQIGTKMGLAGKSTEETLANTRQAVQGLAQLSLDAAAQMKGQGQITEAERALLQRAASGEIQSFTAPELKSLLDVNERVSRTAIRSNKANVERMRANPELASYADYYNVDEPEGMPAVPQPPQATDLQSLIQAERARRKGLAQ